MMGMFVSLFQLWVWIIEKNNYKMQLSWIYLRVCSFSPNEMKCALDIFMDLVSLEWSLVYSSELKDREGCSPVIGLGWGATEVSNFEFSPIECLWAWTFGEFSNMECDIYFSLFFTKFPSSTLQVFLKRVKVLRLWLLPLIASKAHWSWLITQLLECQVYGEYQQLIHKVLILSSLP